MGFLKKEGERVAAYINHEIRFPAAAPLNELDTETQTYGCRHNNPYHCAYCNMDDKCAFAREDNICKRPVSTWKRVYRAKLEN